MDLICCYKCAACCIQISAIFFIHLDSQYTFSKVKVFPVFRRFFRKGYIPLSFCLNCKIRCMLINIHLKIVISSRIRIDIRRFCICIQENEIFQYQMEICMVDDLHKRYYRIADKGSCTVNISYPCIHIKATDIIVVQMVYSNCITIRCNKIVSNLGIKSGSFYLAFKDIYKDTGRTATHMGNAVKYDISDVGEVSVLNGFCVRIENFFYQYIDPLHNFLYDPFYEPTDNWDLAYYLHNFFYYCLNLFPYVFNYRIGNCRCRTVDRSICDLWCACDHVDHFSC